MKTPSRQRWRLSPIKAKPSRAALRLLLAALLLPALASSVAAAPKKSQAVEAKRGELKDLQGRLKALQHDLAKSEENRAEAADQLKETESGISDLNRSLRRLGEARTAAEAEVADLERQAQQLGARIAAQQAQLGRLLYRQYLAGEADALQLLFTGADPNQVARDMHYLSLLARAKADLLRSLRDTLAAKESLRLAAQSKREELAGIEQKRSQERAALVRQQQEHRDLLNRLATKIKTQRAEIDVLKRNEKRLGNLIAGLARIVARAAPVRHKTGKAPPPLPAADRAGSGDFARLKGKLQLPVRGELAGRYGAARGDGGGTWKGLFIRAAEGAEVRALAAGRVVFADWLRGFGNLIIVDHGDAYLSVYGNNQSLFRQPGDSVVGGEVLAAVGNSGGNPQSGLYFELRFQGQTLDPLKWVILR